MSSRKQKGRRYRKDTAWVASTCHVCLAGPQGLKYQLQLPDGCCRLFSTGHVRLQDHFQKANSRSVQVNERLRPQVIVEAFAAVLLQLDLLDPHCLVDHLTPLLPRVDAVRQAPIHRDREPLLGNLVACLHTNMARTVTSP